ncbi:MAG: hypothetical protein H8E20_15440 [Verrucomicrobia bacterium]|nr:hypothetical protein [Verrucomicrobiota bacterium]
MIDARKPSPLGQAPPRLAKGVLPDSFSLGEKVAAGRMRVNALACFFADLTRSPSLQPAPAGRGSLPIWVPWRSFAVFVLAATAALGQAGDHTSTLQFKNGDWLRGTLAAYDQAGGVTWRHVDTAVPLRFSMDQITGITLDGTAVGRLSAGNLCEVQLVNGDHFRGNLAGATAEHFLFDTWHAGRLQLRRSTVRKIAPMPRGLKTLFQGPENDAGWTHGKINNETIGESGNWRHHNGGFHAKAAASIARDLGLPDRSHISFDLEWSGSMHLAFALYTDSLQPISLSTKENEPDFGGFYSVQVNSYSVNLLPVKKREPLTYLGQATVPGFRNQSKARLEFFASKPQRLIAVAIDGKVIRKWTDTKGFAGEGSGVRIVHQGRGAVRISNLRVEEWDGRFQGPPTHPLGAKDDLVKLVNNDRMQGRVDGVDGGKLNVTTAEGGFPVPLDRVKQIEPSTGKTAATVPLEHRVRAHFSDGSRLTFKLNRWATDGVEAQSPAFGTATFKPTSIMRLEFQPGNK